jgi:predicted PurR-regulated permease PerM
MWRMSVGLRKAEEIPMTQKSVNISYLLAVLAVPLVLHFHLLPAVIAGLAVHVLTVKLARGLPIHWSRMAQEAALGMIAVSVVAGLFGAGFGLWSFLHGHYGMAALLTAVAETLDHLKRTLPAALAVSLPDTVDELQSRLADLMRENGRQLSVVGMEGLMTFAQVLLGMVVGGMTALHSFNGAENWPPLAAALNARLKLLSESFEKVVFAQIKISALNTILTAIYLVVILPLCGVYLPMVTVLIMFTFVAGMLPVVGNLISNAVIVVISLGISPGVGGASTVFLILVHKLEYFTNARIVGGEVHARAWELLCAMLAMDAIFGLGGIIAAPIVYAWLKAELKALELV